MEAKDPVCNMTIEDKDAFGTSEYMGKIYYFCSEACKVRFEKDPGRYLTAGGHFIPPEK